MSYRSFFSLWSWFEVFKETPAGELIEANCHARLNCLKSCWMMLSSFSSIIKKSHQISCTKKFYRMTNSWNKEWQQRKTLSSLYATVTDDVLKLGYTSVIFLDLEVGLKVEGTYYCDLLLSQQLLPAIRHVCSEIIFQKTVPQHIRYARFSDINISQGSVATPLRCGRICNDLFIVNFPVNVTVKEF